MFQAIYPEGGSYYHRTSDLLCAEDGLYHHKYIIEDSNFVEEWEGTCGQVIYNTLVRPGALISCYQSKKENVAFELAMYHKYMQRTYRWYELDKELGYCAEWVPVYKEYARQVKEYLDRFDSFKAFWWENEQ